MNLTLIYYLPSLSGVKVIVWAGITGTTGHEGHAGHTGHVGEEHAGHVGEGHAGQLGHDGQPGQAGHSCLQAKRLANMSEKFFLQMNWNRLYKLKIICQLCLIIPDEEKTLGLLNLPGALASGPLIAISVGISSNIRRAS